MKEKEGNKEFQTRREFFKKAAKGALPIIAGMSLSGCSFLMDTLSPSYGGGYSDSGGCSTCSGGCSGGCDGSCQWGCESTCKGGCTGSSVVKHYGS